MTLGQSGGESTLSPESGVKGKLVARRWPRPVEQWAWDMGVRARWSGAHSPPCLSVILPWALLLLSSTLLSGYLWSPFQCCWLSSSGQTGCLCFFRLKVQRGRFYFQ